MKKKHAPLLGKVLGWLLPGYAVLPLILIVVYNFTVFIGTRFITDGFKHYDFTTAPDPYIPFWPPIVVIYILAFAQWILGYIMIGRSEKDFCYRYCAADAIGKTIAAICFLALPTIMVRPDFAVTDVFTWLTRIVYTADAPTNLFPSIHCMESWICWRSTLEMKRVPSWFRILSFIMTALVCASTVLLKQHLFVDIIGGIAAAEFGIRLSRHTNIGKRLFAWSDILY